MRISTASAALGVFLAALPLTGCSESKGEGSTAGRLEELRLPALRGNPVRVADFSGRVRVVNLWATWCPPCREELPMLERVSRSAPAVMFGIDQGEARPTVAATAAKAKLTYAVLLDAQQEFGAQYATIGLPTTLVLAPDGHVSTLHEGEYTEADLRADIAKAGAK